MCWCHDDPDGSDTWIALPCGHCFHRACFQGWASKKLPLYYFLRPSPEWEMPCPTCREGHFVHVRFPNAKQEAAPNGLYFVLTLYASAPTVKWWLSAYVPGMRLYP